MFGLFPMLLTGPQGGSVELVSSPRGEVLWKTGQWSAPQRTEIGSPGTELLQMMLVSVLDLLCVAISC